MDWSRLNNPKGFDDDSFRFRTCSWKNHKKVNIWILNYITVYTSMTMNLQRSTNSYARLRINIKQYLQLCHCSACDKGCSIHSRIKIIAKMTDDPSNGNECTIFPLYMLMKLKRHSQTIMFLEFLLPSWFLPTILYPFIPSFLYQHKYRNIIQCLSRGRHSSSKPRAQSWPTFRSALSKRFSL